MTHLDASRPAGYGLRFDRRGEHRSAAGAVNGCLLGLGCWAGLFWLVFG